jgi:two-component system sensor histidine kinase RstB
MKNIFFKIYGCVLLSVVFIVFISYFLVNAVNKSRYDEYLLENIGGTFSLIAAGIGRHQSDKRKQWIETAERLTGSVLKIGPLNDLSDYSKYMLGKTSQSVFIRSDLTQKTANIALKIFDETYVSSKINYINQSITRTTALLVLNELGRHSKESRIKVLGELNKNFSFELSLIEKKDLKLDKAQWRQLARGDIVTSLTNTLSDEPSVHVYAPYGNSGLFLAVGPIPTFQWYPISLILPLVLVATSILLMFSYLLVHALEKKLRVLEEGIKKAGTIKAQPIVLKGDNGFARMALSVNEMMLRIDSLVEQQRQLTNDISHELRTPITRIMFRVDSFENRQLDEANVDITGMKKDLKSLNNMIDEMLTYARLDYSQRILRTNFNLSVRISEILDELKSLHPSINFSLNQPKICSVYADKTLLLRAVENLLINACKHCESQVVLSLSTTIDGDFTLTIEDDGPGIAEENRKRVFNPFIRIDESRARELGGFGLGLSIVQRVVQLHKGEIKVDTSSKLSGAHFQVWLPKFKP